LVGAVTTLLPIKLFPPNPVEPNIFGSSKNLNNWIEKNVVSMTFSTVEGGKGADVYWHISCPCITLWHFHKIVISNQENFKNIVMLTSSTTRINQAQV
jgi:hypothetical protein